MSTMTTSTTAKPPSVLIIDKLEPVETLEDQERLELELEHVAQDILNYILFYSASCRHIFQQPSEATDFVDAADLYFIVYASNYNSNTSLTATRTATQNMTTPPMYLTTDLTAFALLNRSWNDPEWGNLLFLTLICTAGQGLGTLLLQSIIEYAEENGFDHIGVEHPVNSALDFYSKFGFERDPMDNNLYLTL